MSFKFNRKRQNHTIHFQNLVSSIVDEYKLEKLFTIERLQGIWSEIIGDIMSTHAVPYKLHHGILFIAVDHPVYANEMIMMKDMILQKINSIGSLSHIKDIRAEVKRNIDRGSLKK